MKFSITAQSIAFATAVAVPTLVMAQSGDTPVIVGFGESRTISSPDILVLGQGDIAISAVDGGEVEILDGRLESAGGSGTGLLVGAQSSATVEGTEVSAFGDGGVGVRLEGDGDLTMTDALVRGNRTGVRIETLSDGGANFEALATTIEATAAGGVALDAAGEATITLRDSELRALAAGGSAIRLTGGNDFTASHSTIETDGVAIDLIGSVAQSGNRIELTGSSVTANLSVLRMDAGRAGVYLYETTLSGDRHLLQAMNGAQLDVRAVGSTLAGDLLADTGSRIDLQLTNDSQLTGAAQGADIFVGDDSLWNVTADSSLGMLRHDGLVRSVKLTGREDGASSYKTITVGEYQAEGGWIQFNTRLGYDNSLTDRLLILGDSAGQATVVVHNQGGLGGATANGIRLIEVQGRSDAEFDLAGDYLHEGRQTVIAGAYGYGLYKNARDGTEDGDWYLRSHRLDGKDSFQPAAPVYEGYGRVLLGLNKLEGWLQRTQGRTSYGDGIWTRVQVDHTKIGSRKSTTGAGLDMDHVKVQAGFDTELLDNGSGALLGGMAVHYITGGADIKANSGQGRIKTDGLGISASLTWLDESGFYIDGQAQLSRYQSDLDSFTL